MTPEESLSWGGFELWVKGKNLCFHVEQGETCAAVHWYLLCLLEWFAANWDEIFHEERLPNRNAAGDAWASLDRTFVPPEGLSEKQADDWQRRWRLWWARHALLACRDGGLFPDVILRRWQDKIEISWANSRLAGVPEHFDFLFNGDFARLPPQSVADPIYQVLTGASRYLCERLPDSPRLQSLRRSLDRIPSTPEDTRVTLMAGLADDRDHYEERWHGLRKSFPEISDDLQHALFGTGSGPGEKGCLVVAGTCQASLMFGSVAPSIGEPDALLLADRLVNLYAPDAESDRLRRLTREESVDQLDDSPWRQGYRLAEEIHSELGLASGDQGSVDVEAVCSDLGIGIESIRLDDRDTRAVAIAGPKHKPCVLLNDSHDTNQSDSGRRFSLAHELCHLLFDRSYGRQLAMASGPWAPVDIEKRANAFAAMFLMPRELVRRSIAASIEDHATVPGIHAVSRGLKTSFVATLEHLTNLGFLTEAARDRLREGANQQA